MVGLKILPGIDRLEAEHAYSAAGSNVNRVSSLSFFLESPLPLAFPGMLCATGAPSIVVDSMQMLRRRLVPRLHAALEHVLRTCRQGATF